jgi:prefoldin subunit 5
VVKKWLKSGKKVFKKLSKSCQTFSTSCQKLTKS